MNRKLTAAAALLVLAVPLGASAQAAPPKGFTKTVDFTDASPDPSGNAESGNEMHCSGKLPQETPIAVKVPGPGIIDVTLAGFQGDWALQIRDADGEVLAGDDVNPPAYETAEVRLKKAATINILPCNMTGTPQAKVTYKFTPKKK
jgi:hypothetical protein